MKAELDEENTYPAYYFHPRS